MTKIAKQFSRGAISANWKALMKPNYTVTSSSSSSAEFILEPLEPGFGTTIGNSLRRILLSCIRGAAAVALKIDGVYHEFCVVDGVLEDVPEIVLNIKQLIIKSFTDERKKLRLVANGPGPVYASMITHDEDIEIMNKDMLICTLDKKANIDMDIYVSTGSGYTSAEENKWHDMPAGSIAIDALFSPVKRVSFDVERSRVGSDTEYDKLILKVDTDGSMDPELAIKLSAKILQDQLQVFSFATVEADEEGLSEEQKPKFNENLFKRIDTLDISVRPRNCLANLHVVYVGDLVLKPESEMMQTPNFGKKSLNEIKAVLEQMDLKLGMTINEWPPEDLEELAKHYEEQLNYKL